MESVAAAQLSVVQPHIETAAYSQNITQVSHAWKFLIIVFDHEIWFFVMALPDCVPSHTRRISDHATFARPNSTGPSARIPSS